MFTVVTVITAYTSQNEGKALTRNKKPAVLTVFTDFTAFTRQNEGTLLRRVYSQISLFSLLSRGYEGTL